jgi:hypothetical protein
MVISHHLGVLRSRDEAYIFQLVRINVATSISASQNNLEFPFSVLSSPQQCHLYEKHAKQEPILPAVKQRNGRRSPVECLVRWLKRQDALRLSKPLL